MHRLARWLGWAIGLVLLLILGAAGYLYLSIKYEWGVTEIASRYMIKGKHKIWGEASDAAFEVPEARLRVVVSISPTHPFLAQFHRTIRIESAGETIAQDELFPDTGGYGRIDVYRIDQFRYLFCDSWTPAWISVARPPSLSVDASATGPGPACCGSRPAAQDYVGSFDFGPKDWSFYRKHDGYSPAEPRTCKY